jgi:hypothetical protein
MLTVTIYYGEYHQEFYRDNPLKLRMLPGEEFKHADRTGCKGEQTKCRYCKKAYYCMLNQGFYIRHHMFECAACVSAPERRDDLRKFAEQELRRQRKLIGDVVSDEEDDDKDDDADDDTDKKDDNKEEDDEEHDDEEEDDEEDGDEEDGDEEDGDDDNEDHDEEISLDPVTPQKRKASRSSSLSSPESLGSSHSRQFDIRRQRPRA